MYGFDPTSRRPTQNLEPFVSRTSEPVGDPIESTCNDDVLGRDHEDPSKTLSKKLLQKLEAAANRVPNDVPIATPRHRLAVFAADPLVYCVAKPGEEEDRPIVNQMMESAIGWVTTETGSAVKVMLNRGEFGLDGFIHFMKFFVVSRGLEGALFEEALLNELERR